jgi:hypothetical protein
VQAHFKKTVISDKGTYNNTSGSSLQTRSRNRLKASETWEDRRSARKAGKGLVIDGSNMNF